MNCRKEGWLQNNECSFGSDIEKSCMFECAPALQNNVGCSKTFLESLNFSQVAGLFLGMVIFGFTVDKIGRKQGSIATAVIMFIGAASSI